MRRVALAVAAVLVALGLALVVWGAFLPRQHRVTSEATLARRPEEVWNVIRDLGSMPRWWPEVRESARAAGDGSGEQWRQVVGGFEMTLAVEEERPPQRLVTEIVTPDDSLFGGRWIYELQGAGTGTRVRLTEDGWVGPWPFRTIVWLSGYHASIDDCLTALGRHFGEQVTPRHVDGAAALPPAAPPPR
jgi:uncharacterized protein YndB with AHSA1/START domain